MKEARFFTPAGGSGEISCHLCCHRCRILDQQFGFCGVRQARAGRLYTHTYGKLIAANIDPIEKKPLYHFLPGSRSFSIATIGCNFRCGFCQNWEISQVSAREGPLENEEVPVPEVVRAARESGCASIAYTYTEPTIYLEYALDVAAQAKEAGIKNVFVTNGYMTPEALEEALPFMDAANVDLKFSDDEQYLKHCGGKFSPVVDSIGRMHRAGVWVEVTTLVIPGENDQPKALEKIAGTIAGISPNIPWHVSRYHPDYKFEEGEPTAEKTLERAQVIGRHAGLAYVYAGNIIGWGNDTNCPSCGVPLITRAGIALEKNTLKEGKCPGCGAKVPGVFA